jgi:hypothetical protein
MTRWANNGILAAARGAQQKRLLFDDHCVSGTKFDYFAFHAD